jgi:hypothetical protein
MAVVYSIIAQILRSKQEYGKSMKYCNIVMHWVDN